MKYVIIGGGVCGTTAAEELRKLEKDAEITIISEEMHALYSRVLLPHWLKGKVERDRVFLKKESWYHEQNIEWIRGERAVKIDTKNKFVELTNARELPYDKLLIATGGDVRTYAADAKGVMYFRGLDDADHIDQLMRAKEDGVQGFVYGGGFIACEFVNLFAHYNIKTSIAYRGGHFWSKIFQKESGALINEHLVKNGVEVYSGISEMTLHGEKELEAIEIAGTKHQAGLLGIGIGIDCDNSCFENAGLEFDGGLVVNEYLETNIEDVYAAGDVAKYFDTTVNRHLLVGNWMNAMMQARIVAKTMAGERTPFALVSSYATNILGLEIIFVGDVSIEAADEVQVVGSALEGGVTQLFIRDKKLVGATIIGRNTDRAPITKQIRSKTELSADFVKTSLK